MSIELVAEHLFPRSEIRLAFCNCNNYFTSGDRALQVRVSIVFVYIAKHDIDYRVFKVIDILGNDTTKTVTVK